MYVFSSKVVSYKAEDSLLLLFYVVIGWLGWE